MAVTGVLLRLGVVVAAVGLLAVFCLVAGAFETWVRRQIAQNRPGARRLAAAIVVAWWSFLGLVALGGIAWFLATVLYWIATGRALLS